MLTLPPTQQQIQRATAPALILHNREGTKLIRQPLRRAINLMLAQTRLPQQRVIVQQQMSHQLIPLRRKSILQPLRQAIRLILA